jgi:hypothetical protein
MIVANHIAVSLGIIIKKIRIMKLICFIVFIEILLLQISCKTYINEKKDKSDINIKRFSIYFDELNKRLNKDNGRLWNCRLEGPVILADKKSREVYANTQDSKGALLKRGNVYIGTLPENVNISSTAKEWNGTRWAMIAMPLPAEKEERLSAFIHESFHRIQPGIGFDSIPVYSCGHLDKKNGRIYLKLELEALKMALNTNNPLKVKEHIMNALFFRQYRYSFFPNSKIFECPLEINEGLAEYTGIILCGKNDIKLRQYLVSRIELFYNLPTFVGGYAYITIPIYGYFMQKQDKHWNLKINKKTNLTDFILDFFNQPEIDNIQKEVEKIRQVYPFETIVTEEEEREKKQQDIIEKYKAKFFNDTILNIKLINKRISFNPGNLIPLEDFGIIYPNLRLVDIWGVLTADSGALINTDRSKIIISKPLSAKDSIIRGNGWQIKLNDSWKLVKDSSGYTLKQK